MSYGSFAPPRRRFLPQGFQPGAPKIGPDIEAAPPAIPAQPPVIYEQDSGLGDAIGKLGSAFVNKFQSLRAPQLKPDGSSPFDSLMPGLKRGGYLRDVGDVAVVGEDAPELAVQTRQGTQIIPLKRTLAAVRQVFGGGDTDSQPSGSPAAPAEQPLPTAVLNRTRAVINQLYGGDTGGQPVSDNSSSGTRPRTVGADPYAKIRALATVDPNAPVTTAQSEYRPAAPTPLPTTADPDAVQLSDRAPMAGRVRNAPQPGEEGLNDLQFQNRVGQYPQQPTSSVPNPPGYDTSGATETRARFADPAGRLQNQINYERQNPAHARQGRSFARKVVDVLEAAGLDALQGAAATPENPLAGAAGGAATGALLQGVRPDTLAQMKQAARVRGYEGELQNLRGEQLEGAKVRTANAQAGWLEARPQLAEDRNRAAALKTQQSALQREIGNRSKEPRPFDATDPYDSDLMQRAQAAGVSFDPKSFGDFKTPVTMEVEDPTDPNHIRKTRKQYNRVTGEWEDIDGASGAPIVTRRVQPVDDKGMTPAQELTAKDRETARAALQRQRDVSNDLRRQGLALEGRRFDLSRAQFNNRLGEQTRGELKNANALAAKSEEYARSAQDLSSKTTFKDPDTGEIKESKKWAAKRDEYLSKAAALRRQLMDTYGYLWSPSEGEAPRMSLDQFRGLFPNSAGSPAVEASRLGVTLSDTDQGVRSPASPMPRRGAPMRGAAPPAQSKGNVSRAKFRAKFPQYQNSPDSDVDAAISAAGYSPIP